MTPAWLSRLPVDLIANKAQDHGLDADVLCAIIMKESRGDQWAMRYEPGWSNFWFPRHFADLLQISFDTEQQLQKFSYGLTQVMGAVARQHGYKDDLPKLLSNPELAIEYACLHLKWLRSKCRGEEELIIAYNGGWGALKKMNTGMFLNQTYLNSVNQFLHELRRLD